MAKNPKQSKEKQEHSSSSASPAANLPNHVLDVLKTSFTSFDKISEEERKELYGDRKFLDQFWTYFSEKNPSLLSQLNKDELPQYLDFLDKKGFSIYSLVDNATLLHKEFTPATPERQVMQETLKSFDEFCKDSLNDMPAGVFKKFADEM